MSEASRLARPDRVAEFLRDRCQRVHGGRVLTHDLAAAFRHWRGIAASPSEAVLWRRLSELGFASVRIGKERAWAGLVLKREGRR